MAVCPWCKVKYEVGWLVDTPHAYCMSKLNPDVSKDVKMTSTGVAWARCYEGEKVNGLDYKHCPFFKAKAKKKR